MGIIKNNNFPLRFRTKTQKNTAKRLAKRNRDSLNEYILSLIDKEIELKKKPLTNPVE
jgi:hypothetical protein